VVAEPPPDLEAQTRALCELLNAYGVDYLVLGSMAGRLQGADVRTLDVDVAPRRDPENLERLADALNVLRPRWRSDDVSEGFKIDGRLEPDHFLRAPMVVGLVTRLGRLDIVFHVDGFDGVAFDALAPRAVRIVVGDVEMLVSAVEDVITSKRAAGREKDRAHLPALERLAERLAAQRPPSVEPEPRKGVEPELGP
jgi:hypothetical protein